MRTILFLLLVLIFNACETKFENPEFLALPGIRLDSLQNPVLNSSGNGVNCRGFAVVTSSGNLEVERGFIWDDTITNPVWGDNDGVVKAPTKGVGSYNILVSNIAPDRTVYIRAYAKNAKGVALSATQSVTTPKSRPRLIANPVKNITSTSATFSGTLVFTGGEPVTQQGFVYGLNPNPNFNTGTRIDAGTFKEGEYYQAEVTGLTPNTRYNVRCFAVNSRGESFSTQVTFTTLP